MAGTADLPIVGGDAPALVAERAGPLVWVRGATEVGRRHRDETGRVLGTVVCRTPDGRVLVRVGPGRAECL